MPFFKKITKKTSKDAAKMAGTIIGDGLSQDARAATNVAVEGMDLFKWKVGTPIVQNGHFDQVKGNLFEYIEAAKFNINAASKGMSARAIVTDVTNPHAKADIEIHDGGKVVKEIQAKFIKSSNNGRDNSAAKSVHEQTGAGNKGWGQYDGMDRLIRKQADYNEKGSLLDEAKFLSKNRAESNGIHAETYKDVHEHLTDETHYGGATSGGTKYEEVLEAYNNPEKYARQIERKQVAAEMKCSATNMAKASFVTTGIASGVTNMFDVFQDKKELSQAIADVGVDAVKGGIRGGATGVVSTAIRYKGIKAGSALLSDSTAATVMAGGIIDGGVALYSYAKGEISSEELKDALVDTTAKAASTIYFTKAVAAIMGKAVNPFVPMAVYTTASYVVTCTREIIKNANLNAEEYERMAAVLQESTRQMDEYHREFKKYVDKCEAKQRQMFDRFLNTFEYNLETGENYDQAVFAIVRFADEAGIVLQHVSFDEFSNAMRSKEPFVLK
ncbi:hypothetical protein [Butyrivibrio sp. M55]|uniref:hypothetical protein n=1 Tax=Butyrivibrio sp. M55 TaxID=1855323 RepID=UPI0008F1F66F|nr:hypothetical protein [Butyrivibrio sp. M55]SFU57335.1 hypothetical protein SAMN05216540_10411 [Butyrivibrio sp. M55]